MLGMILLHHVLLQIPTYSTVRVTFQLLYFINLFHIDTGVAVLHYLQSMTTNLSLGAEFLLQKVPWMEVSALSLAGNYKGDGWEFIGKAGIHQWSLCKYLTVKQSCTLMIIM